MPGAGSRVRFALFPPILGEGFRVQEETVTEFQKKSMDRLSFRRDLGLKLLIAPRGKTAQRIQRKSLRNISSA